MPAYNAAPWIADAMESIRAQTWRNKEAIIIDDGSTDETFRIAQRYVSKGVEVITQKNAGACAARNKALSLAQGDFIQWLDADDILSPEKIEHQIKISAQLSDPLVLYTSAWGQFYYRIAAAKFVRTSLWCNHTPVSWLTRKFKENIYMPPISWLVSRKLTEMAGPWDQRLSQDDDGEYFCRVVCASKEVDLWSNRNALRGKLT